MRQQFRHKKRLREDSYVDEINIKLVERYKTSELSGDEWRFSAVIEFKRKGQVLHTRGLSDIETALKYAQWALATAYEDSKDGWEYAKEDDECMQPGCAERACSEFELIEHFSSQGEKIDKSESSSIYYRRFCKKHLLRGDCGREDSDANYRVVSGPGPNDADMSDANVVESARVEVHADSIEDAPEAVKKALNDLRRQDQVASGLRAG